MTNQIINNIENKFIYLPIYLSDYVSQSRKLTMLQRGALIDLSVLYFQENLKINYTKEQIYRLVFAFTNEEQNAIDFILENYFTKSENKPTGYFWVSNQLDEIGGKVLKKLNASRENGKKGGRGNKKEIKPIGLDLLNPEKTILNESKLNQIKENEINLNKPKIKKFIKPSIQEIKDYCQERKNSVDAEKFFDYYEARAWKEIKNWQACVRTWERNGYSSNSKPQTGYQDTYSYNPNNYKHLLNN
jgi:uncharacterized protein YdaU (DUF1376 family)